MLRRSHKKSKGGCVQCKRRHIKCDEGRPICRLCILSERECSFASQAQAQADNLSTSGQSGRSSSHERSTSPGDGHSPAGSQGGVSPDIASLNVASRSKPESPEPPGVGINNHVVDDPTLDAPLNLIHMELLIHMTTDMDIFVLGHGDPSTWSSDIAFALKTALRWPYFLHQLLAFSARHLAYLHPERSALYSHQAVTLQTRAVSLFNAYWARTGVVDRENCVPVLLFSSILGHHVLADTLAMRHPGGLDAFLQHYLQCLEMHRGTFAIARTAWPLLMETEVEPVLSVSQRFTSREPRGDHCARVRELVDGSQGIGPEAKDACRRAIRYLQIGFDAVLAEEDVQGEEERFNRYQMISSWAMLAPPEVTVLLAAGTPEALVMLAYYALLLHYGRKMWQVGGAGAYILGMIGDYLGPQWDYWLEYPRQKMAEDVVSRGRSAVP